MTDKASMTPSWDAIPARQSASRPDRRPFKARLRQRSVINISRSSQSTGASAGNAVPDILGAVGWKRRCIAKAIIGHRLHTPDSAQSTDRG